jgi:hypothetical protein
MLKKGSLQSFAETEMLSANFGHHASIRGSRRAQQKTVVKLEAQKWVVFRVNSKYA